MTTAPSTGPVEGYKRQKTAALDDVADSAALDLDRGDPDEDENDRSHGHGGEGM